MLFEGTAGTVAGGARPNGEGTTCPGSVES